MKGRRVMTGRSQQQKRRPCRLTGKRSSELMKFSLPLCNASRVLLLAFRSGCRLVCTVYMVCCGFAFGLQWHLTRFAVLTRLVLLNVGHMLDVFGLVRAGWFFFFFCIGFDTALDSTLYEVSPSTAGSIWLCASPHQARLGLHHEGVHLYGGFCWAACYPKKGNFRKTDSLKCRCLI